jgi:hypothetical protein
MRSDDLERELDAALVKYATVQPRAGLEQRVLANLRAQGEREVRRAWWLPATAMMMAVVIAAILLGWREHYRRSVAAVHVATKHVEDPVESREESAVVNVPRESAVARHTTKRELQGNQAQSRALPKLGRFPAPEPLSEQEKLLVRFVEDDPREAALVAQTTAEEELERDQLTNSEAK